MLRKKGFWIGIVLVLALGGAGYYFYATRFAAAAEPAETESLQTAVASQGDLVIMASGTGSIVPARQINLGFQESGTLIELDVQEGDEVTTGQVLARLQTSESADEIASKVAAAELTVIQAQNSLDDLYENSEVSRTEALNNIATYSGELRDAQYTMENYTMPIYLQGLDTVEAVEMMKAELDQAFEDFEPYKYLSEYDDKREAVLEVLNDAQARYDAAVDRLNKEYVLQVAEANLAKAQQDYAKYADGPAADELAEAQATLENTQANLALADEDKPVLDLAAPFDGTVISTDAIVGGTVSESAIITLADLEPPTLEVYLDESDLDKVVLGYPAEVVFDAYPDSTFTGKVTHVYRSLESVSDVAAVKALVELDTEGLDPGISLPVGLNAAVDVIAGRATNAVLVPIEALRDLGDGEYAVFVIENGQPVLRVVEVGLMDLTSAEIKSGLEVGEEVSTGVTQVE
jgi:RND family efflux transporter MFP subunit